MALLSHARFSRGRCRRVRCLVDAAKGRQPGEPFLAGASPELQGTLTKIIDQISRLEGLNLKDMTSSEVAGVDLEVQALKADLHARELELAALRAMAPAGGAPGDINNSGSGADTSGLNQRVRELEAKLAEYEILEDDIADLSLYKDENTKLRGEIERLKSGSRASLSEEPIVAAKPSPAPEPAPAPVEAAPSPVVRSTPAAVSEAAASAAEAAGALMADFESTVKIERETHQGTPTETAGRAGRCPRSADHCGRTGGTARSFRPRAPSGNVSFDRGTAPDGSRWRSG